MAVNPVDIVTQVIRLQNGDFEPVFDVTPTTLMFKYFTLDFVNAWAAGMQRSLEYKVFDGDPISQLSQVTSLDLSDISGGDSDDPNHATVVANIRVTIEDGPPIIIPNIIFSMLKVDDVWKIDNMDAGAITNNKYGIPYKHLPLKEYMILMSKGDPDVEIVSENLLYTTKELDLSKEPTFDPDAWKTQ
jgi:hypothetical protein